LFEDDAASTRRSAVVNNTRVVDCLGNTVTRAVAPQCHPAAGKWHAGLRFPRQRPDPDVDG
jgi:hypothetical protein